MTDQQLQTILSVLKVAVAFINGFAGILAAYPGPELPALARLCAAATVGGCGAVLLLTNPPGGGVTVSSIADELEKRRATRAASIAQRET